MQLYGYRSATYEIEITDGPWKSLISRMEPKSACIYLNEAEIVLREPDSPHIIAMKKTHSLLKSMQNLKISEKE